MQKQNSEKINGTILLMYFFKFYSYILLGFKSEWHIYNLNWTHTN